MNFKQRFRIALLVLVASAFSLNGYAENSSPVQNRLDQMGAQVNLALSGDTTGVYTIRLKAGTMLMPKDFILHTAQTKGRFLQLEQESPELIDLDLADIWIWNEDESVSELFDEAIVVTDHPIVLWLEQQCLLKAEMRQIDIEIPNSTFRHQRAYLSFGGQVIAYSPVLEPLMSDIMQAFAKMNCY